MGGSGRPPGPPRSAPRGTRGATRRRDRDGRIARAGAPGAPRPIPFRTAGNRDLVAGDSGSAFRYLVGGASVEGLLQEAQGRPHAPGVESPRLQDCRDVVKVFWPTG